MKKDIWVIRESIAKIVSLLTKQAIKVTQRGTKAYVSYHPKTGMVQLVNIPYLPDDASDDFIAAVQGFLDHEVAHVLYTDQRVVMEAAKLGKRVKNLHNVFEDVYIERRMTAAFPGAVANLDATRRFHADRIALPKIKEALARGDIAQAEGYAAVLQIRAWGGQRIAADALRDNPGIAALCSKMAERLGADLIKRIGNIKNSADALDIARQAKARLDPPPPPAPPAEGDAPKEKMPAHSPESGEGDDAHEEVPEGDEAGEGSEVEVRTEADDSDKEREEGSSRTEEETDEAGDKGGEDAAAEGERDASDDDKEAESGEPETGADDTDDAGDAGPDKGESDDAGADDDGSDGEDGSGSEAEDKGEDSGEDLGDEGTGEGSEGSTEVEEGEDSHTAGGSGEGEPEADEDGDTPTSGKASPEPESEEEDAKDSDAIGEEPDLGAAFEEDRDFDDEVSRALTERAVEETHSSDYKIFSTDWDVVEPAPMSAHAESAVKMIEETRPMISAIQKTLERSMASRARMTWNPGQRRGRISPGALYRVSTGDDRVFRQRFETRARTTVASLVVDCSGSMSGSRIRTAGKAAYALSATLERLKIKHEVIGFTTRDSQGLVKAMRAEGCGVRYARDQALYMPVFKGFNDRLDTDACSRMAHLTEGPRWLKENVDGECVRLAAHRLVQQRAERHVMIVLSDGSPCCPGDRFQQTRHLKTTVKELNTAPTLEVIGIGIEHRGVAEFYDKHVFLDDLAELPTTVVAQLAKVLLAE